MSNFESIFSSSTETDPNLKQLFDKKIERPVTELPDAIDSKAESKKFKKFDPETEKRTIFIGNLHKDTKKEDLMKLFKSYGKIESVRFRNIVPEDITKSKKYAFITKQTHPNKQTITSFVRFKDEDSAKNAASEVNGMEYKSLHIRVDIATKSRVHDNKKSVFLGGLPFDCSDEDIYSHFSSCGPIEFVRLIRDNKTGIGKGFGYVQFKTADTVSLAVRLSGSTVNDRKIRVERCVKKQKESKNETKGSSTISKKGKESREKKPHENQDRNKARKNTRNYSEKYSEKSKLSKEDRSKAYRLNKVKKRKFNKKKHVSTNKKDNVKFKI
ncbi:RNA-binding [Brachionus plicatilis]|uniref:RNA-binding n=1 Tax=Brachionus plicatilis TaxID=10195 RepID=A0A3M7S0D4_BRAPC|nr:RNA-binding [Brachionus plicatilis]